MSTLKSSDKSDNSLQILSQTTVLEKNFTVYGTTEEPLFLAKDVAEMIDYAWKDSKHDHRDISKMIQTVDEDEKLRGKDSYQVRNEKHGFLQKMVCMKFSCRVQNLLQSHSRNRLKRFFTISGLVKL